VAVVVFGDLGAGPGGGLWQQVWGVSLAVHPHHQRQGLGSALLRAHHATLDQAGLPAYLEASGTRGRALSLRHGYTDTGRPVQLPGGPAMYPMWRPASRPATAPQMIA
jgi:GNAT superfamily N-acetyltransferase